MTKEVHIKITDINSVEKRRRTIEFFKKYLGRDIDSNHLKNEITLYISIKLEGTKVTEISLIDVSYKTNDDINLYGTTNYDSSIISLPHCYVNLILSRSRIKNALVYFVFTRASNIYGGFDWNSTEEGYEFWFKIMHNHDIDHLLESSTKFNVEIEKGSNYKTINGFDYQLKLGNNNFDNNSKTLNKCMEFIEIINIDTSEKEQRVKDVLNKYCKFPIRSMSLKGNGIRLGFDVTRDLRRNTIKNINLIQATIIHDRSGSIGDYLSTVFNLPDEVIDKLIEKSRLKKLEPYIMDIYACSENGGFNWGDSEEGGTYWNKLIALKDFSKLIKTNSTMCKIDYKKGKLISKEAIEEKKVGYYVRDTKLALDKELLNKEQERSNVEDELKTFKCEYPLNLENIISRERRLEELDQEIKIIKDLQKEFGFEKEDEKKGK